MNEIADYDVRLGRLIQEGRSACGWSQDQLATHLSVSTTVLRRIEDGQTSLPAADAVRIALLLDLSLHDLLAEPRIQDRFDASRLVTAFCMIERPKDRNAVLALVKALAEH